MLEFSDSFTNSKKMWHWN